MKTRILLIVVLAALLLPSVACADSPITQTTMYQTLGNSPFEIVNIDYSAHPLVMSYDYGFAQTIGDSKYYSVTQPGDGLWIRCIVVEGQTLNYEFTTASGKDIKGTLSVKNLDLFSRRFNVSMNNISNIADQTRVPFINDLTDFDFDYVYNNDTKQYGIALHAKDMGLTTPGNSVAAGCFVTPLVNSNDTITSFYVVKTEDLVGGNEESRVIVMENSPGFVWHQDLQTPTISSYLPLPSNELQDLLNSIKGIFDMLNSIFNSLKFAFTVFLALFFFIINPVNLMLTLIMVEFGAAAFITNTSKTVFHATSRFARFNISMFKAFMFFAEISIRLIYWIGDLMMKMPDILSKAASTVSGIVKDIISVAAGFLIILK